MNDNLYEMIFKRKSFHLFRNIGNERITEQELKDIENEFNNTKPLVDDIKVKMKIVKDSTTCRRGQEYCILIYSEKKDNYLQNIGYIGEQLDLYLVSKNIGTLWCGIGKVTEKQLDGLDFVTMMAIGKVPENMFRKDMFKSKRKPLEEIWEGSKYLMIANIVRFTPSSCNTQPWFVKEDNHQLSVYRYRKPGKRGIMPVDKVVYQNLIDIGIFIYFLGLCLNNYNINHSIEVFSDNEQNDAELTLSAIVKFI